MCGIAGILSLAQEPIQNPPIYSMTRTLVHRGPDGEGFWINPSQTIALGHRRLAIIDLSKEANQPMHYLNRYTIVYNGEIYNYIELREELRQKGVVFQTESDTEVILAAYATWGISCLSRLDGMFAFALWDEEEKTLFCARDRFGEKPFFYTIYNNCFYFASEIKALFAAGIPYTISNRFLYHYMVFGRTENPTEKHLTFYQYIYRLPNHHYLFIKNGQIQKKSYWNLEIDEVAIPEGKAVEQFRELFFKSIQRRMRSDVTVGTSLSGGLDSSSIACSIHYLYPKQVYHTFSGVFPGFQKDESPFIREVIKHTHFLSHTTSPTAEEIYRLFAKVFYHQEEPFGSMSICLQYCVFQLAKQHQVIVLLDGQGADEALAGYHFYYYNYLFTLLRKSPFHFLKVKKEIERLHQIRLNLGLSFYIHSFVPKLWGYVAQMRRQFLSPNHPYFKGLHPDIVQAYQNEMPIYPIFSTLKHYLKWSLVDQGLHELLRYADRNSMAHSIEVRLPFLYHKLVEFLMRLPIHYIIREGWTKWILRKAMDGILPSLIQWRKDKIGYEPPQDGWLKHPLMKKLIQEAQSYLLKEKIITHVAPNLEWVHLNLYFLHTIWSQVENRKTTVFQT